MKKLIALVLLAGFVTIGLGCGDTKPAGSTTKETTKTTTDTKPK